MRGVRGAARGLLCAALVATGIAAGAGVGESDETNGKRRDRFDAVVIDAGHGGDDEGARGPAGLLEKEVVLDLAHALASRLERRGLRVVMTRRTDVFVPLEERTAIANDARADLFVSIHANAAHDPEVRGIETFFLSMDATDEAARRLAERENRAFGEAAARARVNDPLVAILGDLMSNEHQRDSGEFAQLAQKRLATIDPHNSRGVKQAPFVVLMGVQMPATLVEIGFVTNRAEERALAGRARRDRLVAALESAVVEFGRRYDVRRGASAAARADR